MCDLAMYGDHYAKTGHKFVVKALLQDPLPSTSSDDRGDGPFDVDDECLMRITLRHCSYFVS